MICLLLVSEMCRFNMEFLTRFQVVFIGGTVTGLLFSGLMVKITQNVIRHISREAAP